MTSEQDFGAAINPSYSGEAEKQTLSVWALTALVVGSMVGAPCPLLLGARPESWAG